MRLFSFCKFAFASLTFLLTLLISGCSHYGLGPVNEVPFSTLYVEPARNQSFSAQTQALLTQQVIEAFTRDGTVRIVACEEDADATLSITIDDLIKNISATSETDTRVAKAFDVTLVATISLYDNCDNSSYFCDHCVRATLETFVNNSFQQAEFETLPELTRKLAQNIRDAVLSVW